MVSQKLWPFILEIIFKKLVAVTVILKTADTIIKTQTWYIIICT